MSAFCQTHNHQPDLDQNQQASKLRQALIWVIGINITMFLTEIFFGHVAFSEALKADSLDFLGDSATYALSLILIGFSIRWRALITLLKSAILAVFAVWILAEAILHIFLSDLPRANIMLPIAFLALVANLGSALLLLRFRNGDANMRSVWLCSRNDAIGNFVTLIAAIGVFGTDKAWPDIIVAVIMAALFLSTALRISAQALRELQQIP